MKDEKLPLRVGAINWDASLPAETYFGGYAVRNLSTPEFCDRLPFFAQKLPDGTYRIPVRSQADYDRELTYAIEGGIDFFVFCWYPDDDQPRTFGTERYEYLAEHFHELNTARKLYQSSALNRQIGMCAIVFSIHAYSENDLEALFDAMRQDYYEKIDGRPLVVIYNLYDEAFIRELRERAAEKGLELYVACIHASKAEPRPDFAQADAVTCYAVGGSGEDFAALNANARNLNRERLHFGPKVIPIMSAGWNPMPRVKQPCPWVGYGSGPYAGRPTDTDLEEAFCQTRAFIEENPDKADTGLAFIFAWNEFEEGGYLCPTLAADGSADDTALRAFEKAKKQGEQI